MNRDEQIAIPFSEALMEKIGVEQFGLERNKNFLNHIVFYCIDSKYRKIVHLSQWFKEQVELAKKDLYFVSIVTKMKDESVDNDDFMRRILLYTIKRVYYLRDSELEFWQSPLETHKLCRGDCEDGAIMMAAMAIIGGISVHQILLNGGPVYDETSTFNKLHPSLEEGEVEIIGHCWLEYLSEADGVPRIMDWCYWPNTKSVKSRPFYMHEPKYYTPWFKFNTVRYYGRYKNGE